jgi:hypothetical protein
MLTGLYLCFSPSDCDKSRGCTFNPEQSRPTGRKHYTLYGFELSREIVADTTIDTRDRISFRPALPVLPDRRVQVNWKGCVGGELESRELIRFSLGN